MTVEHRSPPAERPRAKSSWGCSALLLLALATAGCEANQSGDGGGGGMFGLFRGSQSSRSTSTVVAAETGAALVRASAFPAATPAVADADFGNCRKLAMDGVPPQAKLLDQPIRGQTTTAYRIDGSAGQPPLVLANIRGAHPRIDLWELGAQDRFASPRPLQLEAAQANWVGFLLQGVACLPQQRLLLAVSYTEPEPRDALYVYDIAGRSFAKLGRVDPDPEQPGRHFEVRAVAADAAIALYFSDVRRQGPERYLNQYHHLRLYSPRYPQGLALLKLGIDDGNIARWAVVGKTLWLDTVDARDAGQPKRYIWSLDLSKVL